MRRIRFLLVAAVAGLAVLAAALPASACSCMQSDPRDDFLRAEAAIIGEFVGSRPSEDPDAYEAIYTFNVEDSWKVEFGETLDVYSAENGAACGLELAPGQSAGLFLYMDGDEWRSSLCLQRSPQQMREAASPLPEPNGSGPVRMIVGGSFGEARVVALDGDGQTLAYGYGGNRDVIEMDACPGGKRVVEIYQTNWDEGYDRRLAVRKVSDLSVVREVDLPFPQAKQVPTLDCRDARARELLLFVAVPYGKPDGAIYRLTGDKLDRMFDGLQARSAEFGDRHVYLSGAKHRLSQMRLDGGNSKILYSTDQDRVISRASVSEDGRYVAFLIHGTYEPQRGSKLAVVDRDRDQMAIAPFSEGDGFGSLLRWQGSSRLVVVSGDGSRTYSPTLEKLGSMGRVFGSDAVVRDGKVWVVSFGQLLRGALPDRDINLDGRLPSPVTLTIVAVPHD